ncbi:MAG: DUF4265 domain-containing protein [Planctomycetota bacterium]
MTSQDGSAPKEAAEESAGAASSPSKTRRIRVELENFPRHEFEVIWGIPTEAEDEFLVHTAPFLSDAFDAHDTVRVEEVDGALHFRERVRASGAETHRILLAGSLTPEEEAEQLATLREYGAQVEHASNRFFAVEASIDSKRRSIRTQLEFWHKKDHLLLAQDDESLRKLSYALADRPLVHWGFSVTPATPVITLRGILEDGDAIQHVVRSNEEPLFQCLGWSTPAEDEARVATLGQLIERDPTLHDLTHLPVGWHAYRESADQPWTREPYE